MGLLKSIGGGGLAVMVIGAGAPGCSDDDDRDPTASIASSIDSISGTSGATSTSGGDANMTDILDAGAGGGSGMAEGGAVDGCEKVDFLFIIDSSGSMEDEQVNLLSSFPGFISAIEDTLMFNDFQLMVVDAGLIPGTGCDGQLGAGRVTDANGQDCNVEGGKRYATQAQSDLTAAFSCMGNRGFDGPGNEQTMDALLASIGPLVEPGQCNEGFLRDDAVLVITLITDEEDDPNDGSLAPPLDGSCEAADNDPNSAGDPTTWKATVVQAKGGDESAVVVLGLLGDCDVGGSCAGIVADPFDPSAPVTGAEPAPRLRQFVQSFTHGSVGPVCASDYAPFFEEAVSQIATACDEFVPPG